MASECLYYITAPMPDSFYSTIAKQLQDLILTPFCWLHLDEYIQVFQDRCGFARVKVGILRSFSLPVPTDGYRAQENPKGTPVQG
jgi:hypothetical protein